MASLSRMPPFKSIEAFVVAAHSLSFTEAASTLNITVPAVSRRIQALETELGVPLFQRRHRTLSLTPAGQNYFSNVALAIDTIRRASDRVRAAAKLGSVRVGLPASLAANWLVPRLHQFHARHRGVHIQLNSVAEPSERQSTADCPAVNTGEADIVIRLGSGHWPGLRAVRLLELEAFPVGGPGFFSGEKELTPDDLAKLPLLGIRGQPELWREWFRGAGLGCPERIDQEFDDPHLLYSAAVCGLGIALGVNVLVQPYLDAGQLVRPFGRPFKLSKSYWMICRAADVSRRPVSTFRNWLLTQGVGRQSDCAAGEKSGRAEIRAGAGAAM